MIERARGVRSGRPSTRRPSPPQRARRIRFGVDQLPDAGPREIPIPSTTSIGSPSSTRAPAHARRRSTLFRLGTASRNTISARGSSADRAATGTTAISATRPSRIGCSSGRFNPRSMRLLASATARSVVTRAAARAAARMATELLAPRRRDEDRRVDDERARRRSQEVIAFSAMSARTASTDQATGSAAPKGARAASSADISRPRASASACVSTAARRSGSSGPEGNQESNRARARLDRGRPRVSVADQPRREVFCDSSTARIDVDSGVHTWHMLEDLQPAANRQRALQRGSSDGKLRCCSNRRTRSSSSLMMSPCPTTAE